jgi:hypothetical protein
MGGSDSLLMRMTFESGQKRFRGLGRKLFFGRSLPIVRFSRAGFACLID